WTSASTNVNRCAGHLAVHTSCFRPEHASSTTISIKSSVAATPPSGDHRPPTLPPFCDGLVVRKLIQARFQLSFVLVCRQPEGRNERDPEARRDSGCGCRRLQPARRGGRGPHAGAPAGPP